MHHLPARRPNGSAHPCWRRHEGAPIVSNVKGPRYHEEARTSMRLLTSCAPRVRLLPRVPLTSRARRVAYLFAALAATSSFLGWGAARADLDSYLSRPEPVYHWEERGVEEADGCSIHDLYLVSQVWQGITWEHRLQVVVPANAAYPHFCALLNTGGSDRERDTQMGVRMARDSGAVNP